METDKKKAKFELQDLLGIAVIIIVFGIIVVFGVQTQADVRSDINQTTDSEAYDAATDSIEATGKLASKQGILVTAIVAVVIIGLLYKLFAYSRDR